MRVQAGAGAANHLFFQVNQVATAALAGILSAGMNFECRRCQHGFEVRGYPDRILCPRCSSPDVRRASAAGAGPPGGAPVAPPPGDLFASSHTGPAPQDDPFDLIPGAAPEPGGMWMTPELYARLQADRVHDPAAGEGLASVSMWLGVLGLFLFGVFTGLPALITGYIAYTRLKNSSNPRGGRRAMTGMILGFLSVLATMCLLSMIWSRHRPPP